MNKAIILLICIFLILYYCTSSAAVVGAAAGASSTEAAKPLPPRVPGLINGGTSLPDVVDEPGSVDLNLPDISNIPKSNTGCINEFSACGDWAENGECNINPDFMLQNCPQACNRCGLTHEEKNKLIRYYKTQKPPKCIYRGEPYPTSVRLTLSISDMYN